MSILRYFWILSYVMVIFAVFLSYASISARTRQTTSESTCNILVSSTYQIIFHFFLWSYYSSHTSRTCFSDSLFSLDFWKVFPVRVATPLGCCIYPSLIPQRCIFCPGYPDKYPPFESTFSPTFLYLYFLCPNQFVENILEYHQFLRHSLTLRQLYMTA